MNLIAAVDRNWAIGKEGGLLASIRDDMEFFRAKTMGGIIIMGRKTLDSFPGGRPLPGRTNIVLTRNTKFNRHGVEVFHSLEDIQARIADCPKESVFCVGGGSIYKLMLPICDTAFITRIDYSYDADTYFPNLDNLPDWKLVEKSEEYTSFDLTFHFLTYKKHG